MPTFVAERVFCRTDTGETVTARIFAPLKSGPGLWSAKIQILGLDQHVEEVSCGVDSFQALCIALRMVCLHLEKIEPILTFQDQSNASVPVIVPWDFGPTLKTEVYEFANRKILAHMKSLRSATSEQHGAAEREDKG
jgi:hypothetical protein